MAFVPLTSAETDANSPGSTDLFTKIKDNFDDLDSRLTSLQLVEHKEISIDATSVTFSGLDGNTEFLYRLVGRIVKAAASGGLYTIEPNGVAAGAGTHRSVIHTVTTISSGESARDDLLIANPSSSETLVLLDLILMARIQVQGVNSIRHYQGSSFYSLPALTTIFAQDYWGAWKDDTNNLTSLKILCDTASQIRKGSHFSLYKMKPI